MRPFARPSLLLAAAAASVANALNYALPAQFKALALQESDCYYPASYDVTDFAVFKPAEGNGNKTTIDFNFVDDGAGIRTGCHLNATSVSLTPANSSLALRWACDDPIASFIWSDERLTVIEKVCPGQTGSLTFEASGSAELVPKCVGTGCSYVLGDGELCKQDGTVKSNFTSLQPSPL